MPDQSARLRRRAAVELSAWGGLTALYLGLLPERPAALDAGLAVVALALVGLTAGDTRARFWGPAGSPAGLRRRRAARHMVLVTLPVLALFAVFGAWDAFGARRQWADVAARLVSRRFFLALGLYVPWAFAQQTLFQFYLLGRLRALWPGAAPARLAALGGATYGLVHAPAWDLVLLTTAGGVVWSYAYARDRCLTPLALSHAALGATFYHWVRDRDLLAAWLG